MIYNVTNVANP